MTSGKCGGARLQGPKGLEGRRQPHWIGTAVIDLTEAQEPIWPVMEGPEPRSPGRFSPKVNVLFGLMPSHYL